MAHNPLAQFEIKKIMDLQVMGVDLSITNSVCLMFVSCALIISYYFIVFKDTNLVPSRLQMSGEYLYNIVTSMLDQNIGPKGRKYVPLIFSLFLFTLFCNLLGMIPYSFTVTSHISITFALAIMVFFLMNIIGVTKHGLHFFSMFLPQGTPWWMAPLMIIIELFAFLARPISLSLRLAANMVAGHIMLKVIAGFVISLAIYLKFIPIPLIVILIGFEIFVAILQAYIFSILSCVYLNDAINLH